MDSFELDLNPAMGNDLLYKQSDSSSSINYLEHKDSPFFEGLNLNDNFEEHFNQIFHSQDNKEDSITEMYNNYNNINNVDEFIIHFQSGLNEFYFNKDFDAIINKIEKQFPFFFENENSTGLLYLIEKLRFFNLLRDKKIDAAKKFFEDRLIILLKEVKGQNWETKSKFFIKLLKKPNLVGKQGEIQKKYFDKFSFELERAIRSFLHEENDDNENKSDILENSNNNNLFISSSSLDLENIQKINNKKNTKYGNKYKQKFSLKEKEINDGEIEINPNQNNDDDELDLDNISTKEEFSDFEDELQPKISAENEEKKENKEQNQKNENQINLNTFVNEDNENLEDMLLDPVNNNSPFFSNLSMSSFSKSHKASYEIEHFQKEENENECIIDTSSKNNNELMENKINFNEYKVNNNYDNITANETKEKKDKKKHNKKGKDKNQEILFNQLPFLNSFKPKYIKRETIDKKIIRNFKNFIVKEYKQKKFEINASTMDQNFFINFINGNLLPPLDFIDGNTGENIIFNSFNCSYLLWLFSKKGIKEAYIHFINEKGKEFINSISEHYEISPEEKNQLNSYIINYPFIFDISLVNNITQGTEITHLYRTVDKNKKLQNNRRKKKDNDLDLRKEKSGNSIDKCRERSRSREFENDEI